MLKDNINKMESLEKDSFKKDNQNNLKQVGGRK